MGNSYWRAYAALKQKPLKQFSSAVFPCSHFFFAVYKKERENLKQVQTKTDHAAAHVTSTRRHYYGMRSRNLIGIQNTNIISKTWIALAKTTAFTRPKRSWSEEFERYVDKAICAVLLSRIRRNLAINEALFCRAKLSTSSNGRDIHRSKHRVVHVHKFTVERFCLLLYLLTAVLLKST